MLNARSYFCMSTNLSKGCPAVHGSGLLWRMVRASMTIVGLVPPVYEVSGTSSSCASQSLSDQGSLQSCDPCTCGTRVQALLESQSFGCTSGMRSMH